MTTILVQDVQLIFTSGKKAKDLEKQINVTPGTLLTLNGIMANFGQYMQEFHDFVNGATPKVSGTTLQSVNQAITLSQTLYAATTSALAVQQLPDLLTLAEMLTDIENSLFQLLTMPAYFQADVSTQASAKSAAVEYSVRGGDTLESIAVQFNGDPESWLDIAIYNDIDISVVGAVDPIPTWVGKIIQIPRRTGIPTELVKDSNVLDAPIGIRALGQDFPSTLVKNTRQDGTIEIKSLDFTNTFLESVNNRIFTALGDVPDYPGFGSRAPLYVGRNYGPITQKLMEIDIRSVLKSDPRVSDIVNLNLQLVKDAVQIDFQLKLINGITTQALRAHFIAGDVPQ